MNKTYLATAGITRTFMVGAAAISTSHIIATSHSLGLGWEAYTVPAFIDGMAILGLIGRSSRFAASTRRAGLRIMAGAGVVSLACNVYAGHNLGQRLYGVLVVAAFIASEWYSAKLCPAPAPAPEVNPRSEAAKKAAATRQSNAYAKLSPAEKAARTRATRKAEREAEYAALLDGDLATVAPISPAV